MRLNFRNSGQRFVEAVKLAWAAKKFSGVSPVEFGKKLSVLGIKDFAETEHPKNQYGALAAFPAPNQAHLCELTVDCFRPELKFNDKIWYASMGSGQTIADPFLGFLRGVFWQESVPKLTEGIFAVTWVLEHTIDVNPGGIKEPMDIAILENVGKQWKARCLVENEVYEHRQMIAAAKKHLKEFQQSFSKDGEGNLPRVP